MEKKEEKERKEKKRKKTVIEKKRLGWNGEGKGQNRKNQ